MPFLHKLDPKMVIVRGFTNFFFFSRTTGLQLELLIVLIKSLNIFYWKPANKDKLCVILGQNLVQIRSSVVKKVKEL